MQILVCVLVIFAITMGEAGYRYGGHGGYGGKGNVHAAIFYGLKVKYEFVAVKEQV